MICENCAKMREKEINYMIYLGETHILFIHIRLYIYYYSRYLDL